VATCFEMKKVPLVIATTSDQEVFVPWMAGLVGGRVIRSFDAYPLTRLLESLDHLDYVFLRLEGDVPDDLYLLARDYALDRETPLITRLGPYPIHADHRLAIFIDSVTFEKLADDLVGTLRKACTVSFASADDAGESAYEERPPRVFDSIEAAIAWCDRYYANGQFLFRGQTRDWPLTAPLHRLSDAREHEREAKRTLDFVQWLIDDNALLEGVKLDEDQALAVAQHHGLKTPLLDVSRNARVAAFFATHGADLDANEPGILYIFHEGELRKYMNLDGELGEKFGRGVWEPKIEPLRRIRHQQGLFFESRPWLIKDLILARLSFRQKPRGQDIEEAFAPPRQFIFPPPSPFERVVETYLLVGDAIGIAERELGEVHPPPDPSFDSAGLALRAFLDELDPKPVPPLQRVHQGLDAYAGMLALTCSHLLAHQAHYLSACSEATRLLLTDSLTPEMLPAVKKHLCGAQNHMNKAHPTSIASTPHLSIRDLVDGLAVYDNVRSGNPDITPAQFDYGLSTHYVRLHNAYACAHHWLGDLAWGLFPVAGAFALSCKNPIRAYLDAVVEIGKHEGSFLARYSAEEGAQILAQWTGHEPIQVDDLLRQVPLPVFLDRAIQRLDGWRKTHPDRVADLGPFLFKQQDLETARELMPQFTLHHDPAVRVLQHDADLAKTIYPLSAQISLFEGLAGLESTMRCPHAECPFHRFRICGRIPAIPSHPDSCKHRENLEGFYKLTPERLEAFAKVQLQ
jgi:FRG domain